MRHDVPQPDLHIGPGEPGLKVTIGNTTTAAPSLEVVGEVSWVSGVVKVYGYGGGVTVRVTGG